MKLAAVSFSFLCSLSLLFQIYSGQTKIHSDSDLISLFNLVTFAASDQV